MEFRHTQLDNGLPIIAEVNPAAASMAAGFFVQTGSRDEAPEVAGVSHFLEHMVFKGTARRSTADVSRELDEIGASYNAGTSAENTVFYGAVLPEHQSRLLDVLCDVMRPSIRQEDFEREKQVILEEIAMLDDVPSFRLFEALLALHFDGHPLANSVRGTAESVTSLQRDQLQAYLDERYSPTNVTAVGVGNLNFDSFVAKVSELCSPWRRREAGRDRPGLPTERTQKVLTDKELTRAHIGLLSAAPDIRDPDRYAGELLAAIVGDLTGSRFYYALVDPAIADEASTTYEPMDGAGAFLSLLTTDANQAGRALRIARDELQKFLRDGPNEAELAAAKNKIASAATLAGELPMGRLKPVWTDWHYSGQYIPLAKHIETLFAVTGEQVQAVAGRYDPTAATVVALGPLESI